MFSGCGVPAFPSWFFATFLKIVGLPLTCYLWLGVSKGMLPVRHLAKKILMAVNYCVHQLFRRLGWSAPAYHKKEGAIPHPVAHKHSLQYDARPEGRFGMWVWIGNLGSLSRMGGEICDELRKRMIDLCGLQEVRWIGQGAGDEGKEI